VFQQGGFPGAGLSCQEYQLVGPVHKIQDLFKLGIDLDRTHASNKVKQKNRNAGLKN
jgi:hypothetical protein